MHFLLQWHITERCNLHCQHCYQEGYNHEELSFPQLLGVVEQFKNFLQYFKTTSQSRVSGHLTITGGEPFIRLDFMDLLSEVASNNHWFSFAILTNGSMLNAAICSKLKKLQPAFIQVSLEGSPETHDSIRGHGNFYKTINALQLLKRYNLKTFISFTVHGNNYQEFAQVAEIGRKYGVQRVWADRLIPIGEYSSLYQQLLTPQQYLNFLRLMRTVKQKFASYWFNRTEIAMHRALQFLVGGPMYSCSAGRSLITIGANGDVFPCRRLPIKVGNILETPLLNIYQSHPLLNKLRDPKIVSSGCEHCIYKFRCRGGLKCLAFALTGDPFRIDPGCWLGNSH